MGMLFSDHFKSHCIGTEYKFSFLPRKCYFSGKSLFLRNAYKQTAMYTGPGTPVFEYRWYDKDEYLIAKIKGKV